MDYSVHGILQAGILEWVIFPFFGNLPNPGIEPRSPSLQVDSLLAEPPGKPSSEKARWQAPGEGGAYAPSASAALPHLQCAPEALQTLGFSGGFIA